jgi:hypothetical protein
MGPECRGAAQKKGWRFPRGKWRVTGGRMVFDGLDGKVEPPIVNMEKKEQEDDEKDNGG